MPVFWALNKWRTESCCRYPVSSFRSQGLIKMLVLKFASQKRKFTWNPCSLPRRGLPGVAMPRRDDDYKGLQAHSYEEHNALQPLTVQNLRKKCTSLLLKTTATVFTTWCASNFPRQSRTEDTWFINSKYWISKFIIQMTSVSALHKVRAVMNFTYTWPNL